MRYPIALFVWSLFIGACTPPTSSPTDAGHSDASPLDQEDAGHAEDGGKLDGGPADAGPEDGGGLDAGIDAGERDAGHDDAGIDAGGRDAGRDDAGIDAGGRDAGRDDAGIDAGERDAGHTDAGIADGGDIDAGMRDTDAGLDDGGAQLDAGPLCPEGQTRCASTCVVTDFDPSHCGACDARCEAGVGASAACLYGNCVSACPEGRTLCGDACVDVRSSTTHCGACNRGCEAPSDGFIRCESGSCVGSCLNTDALCDGACIRIVDDVANCGDCHTACEVPVGGSVTCADFVCTPACPAEETLCENTCVDTRVRSEHCGECGFVCTSGSHCADGLCVRDAPVLHDLFPSVAHGRAQSILSLTGVRLSAPVSVFLENDTNEWQLTHVLSSDTHLQVRLPPEMDAGRYSLRVETPSGTSKLQDALEIVSAPLRIEVLRAGQGDAQVITSPNGTTMVIDGSIEPVGVQTLRPRFLTPPDYVVVTHYDADHLAGIYALLAGPDLKPNTNDDVDPAIALLDHGDNHSCSSKLCADFLSLRDRLESIGKAKTLEPGEVYSLGAGVTATCLLVNGKIAEQSRKLTAHENENSVGFLVEFLGFSYLAAGDVTGGPIPGCSAAIAGDFVDVETPLARLTGRLDVLKVAHHGSCTATPLAFSALAQPQVGIISMGENNAFCHPSHRVTQNLYHLNTDLYLTNPGVSDMNNASACPVSRLPLTTAPFFSDVVVQVPGDGTFSVRVGAADDENASSPEANDIDAGIDGGHFMPDGGNATQQTDGGEGAGQSNGPTEVGDGGGLGGLSSYRKSYTVLQPRPEFRAMRHASTTSGDLEFLGDEQAHPVFHSIRIRSQVPWTETQAFLLPMTQVTDDALRDLSTFQEHPSAIPIDIRSDNEILELAPREPLHAHSEYAVILPSGSNGQHQTHWLQFSTGLLLPKGAASSLVPPPASRAGTLLDISEIVLDFEKMVVGIESVGPGRNIYLEELESGAEIVTGVHEFREDGKRVALTLANAVRSGPNGESCQSLCPNMTYAIRALGTITDAQGIPIDTETLHTFTTANCSDVAAPVVDLVDVRTFANAVSISLFADEPLEGEIQIAQSDRFDAECGSPTGNECLRIPLSRGRCSGDPCQPETSACHHFVVSEVLDEDTDYTWKIDATDLIGKSLSMSPGSFTTAIPNTSLVIQEVLVDSQQSPESLGEYIEVVNVSMQPLDLCRYRIGKSLDVTGLKALCANQEAWLAPLDAALITGANFCAEKSDACDPEFALAADVQIFRQPTATLLGGLSNTTPPPIYLVDENDVIVSHVFEHAACEEGEAAQRRSLFGPDDPLMFACGLASPGQIAE